MQILLKNYKKINFLKINFIQRKLLKWHKDIKKNYPWRRKINLWLSIVVEIMLQRTKAEQVISVFTAFKKKYYTPKKYLNFKKSKKYKNPFNKLGLVWRERYLIKAAKYLLKEKKMIISKDNLMKIPGVGDYVASAILSLHLNKFAIIIDSNIVRFYSRLFDFEFDGETRRKKWFFEIANKITKKRNSKIYNYSLLDFSRDICSIKPKCNICIISKICYYFNKKN